MAWENMGKDEGGESMMEPLNSAAPSCFEDWCQRITLEALLPWTRM